jgi:hypothetical protein
MTAHSVMTAEDFVKYVRQFVENGEDPARIVSDIEVNGPVDLNASEFVFGRRLSLKRVHFHDDVILANCKFDNSVTLVSCCFDRSLNLGKTIFRNGLSFTHCVFGSDDKEHDRFAIILDDASIRGDLVFEHVKVVGCISARRLQLTGSLEFTACGVTGDSLDERAVFDASDAKIKGSVIFETGRLPPAPAPQSPRRPRSFFRDRRKAGVSVMLRGTKVTDMVNLAWAKFEGEVNLAFVKCRSLESGAGIFARPPGKKRISTAKQQSILPEETFDGARIDGPLTLSGGDFGLIHLHGISVSGAMRLVAGQSGQILIEDALYNGGHDERFIATSRLGHFIMSSWRCSDFLTMHASEVIGKSVPSRTCGILIKSSVIDRGVSFWPGAALQDTLEGYLERDCAEKVPPKFFTTAPIAGRVVNVDLDAADLDIVAVESDGRCRNLLNRWRRQLVVFGNVLIDHSSIGDDLLLTGIDLIAKSEADDGRIEVTDSKIDGNLVFRSPVSFLADAQVDAPLLRLFAQRLVVADRANLQQNPIQATSLSAYTGWQNDFLFVPACCHMLDTTGLRAVKIDLTGLCVRKAFDQSVDPAARVAPSHPAGKRDENPPNAVMGNVKADGKVATFARLSKNATAAIYQKIDELRPKHNQEADKVDHQPAKINWPWELLTICFGQDAASIKLPDKRMEASAEISGSLDLQHSTIAELLISDASFRQHSAREKATDSGIVLDYTQISKLYVARTESFPKAPGHNGFPVPVSLLDFSVKTWFLEDEDEGGDDNKLPTASKTAPYIDQETTTAGPYLDLLENDPAFRMSSYLAIEKSLRDRGLTDEARQIFIAGAYRDVRTESSKNRPVAAHDAPPATYGAGKVEEDAGTPWPGWSPETWRNWKVWRRAEGRYRGSTIVDIRRLLQSSNYSELVGYLKWWLAIFCTAALFLFERSLISLGYLVIVFLSLLALSKAAADRPGWRGYLKGDLYLIWAFGALYAVVNIVTGPAYVGAGYLATIVLSFIAVKGTLDLPADRRLRPDVVVYGACVVVGVFAVCALLLTPLLPVGSSLLAFIYLIIVLCLFFAIRGNLLRLRRPSREYLGFALCFVWCVIAGGLSTYAVTGPSFIGFGALALWVALLFPLSAAMRCFIDQLYWSLVDYGTSALRLAGVIFILMAISFAFVSGDRQNFESTLLAQSIPLEKKPVKGNTPTPDEWVFGERVWMTLRYHVPLVGAIISDEWQPADSPLRFAGWTGADVKMDLLPSWPRGWAPHAPRARDWYGAMLWMNWVLWPLFLPFLIHTLSRER